jgi:hypothetical protein
LTDKTLLANPFEIRKSTKGILMKQFLLAALAAITLAVPAKADVWNLTATFGNPFTYAAYGSLTMIGGDIRTISNVDIEIENIGVDFNTIFQAAYVSPLFQSTMDGISPIPGTWIELGFGEATGNGLLPVGSYNLSLTLAPVAGPTTSPTGYASGGWGGEGLVLNGVIYPLDNAELYVASSAVPEPPGDMDHDDHHHRHHHHLFDDHHLFNDDGHDPTSAVPEPSTWAMLLLGFVGLGVAFQARRRRLAIS